MGKNTCRIGIGQSHLATLLTIVNQNHVTWLKMLAIISLTDLQASIFLPNVHTKIINVLNEYSVDLLKSKI